MISIVLVILIAAIIILPYAFRGRIMEAVKQEVNRNLDARVDFDDLGLGIISSFPNLSLRIDGLSIMGVNEFEGDTLAYVPALRAVVDIMSVIRGDVYEIKRIRINDPLVNLKILNSGKPNWDIVPEGEEEPATTATAEGSTSFNITLRHFEINNARLTYKDIAGNTEIVVYDLDHSLSGDLSAERTRLKTRTTIASISFFQDGVSYLNRAKLDFDALIDADLQNEIYTFEKNQLKINEMILQFEGSVAMLGDDPQITLTFNAPQNTFRNFLSLVPAVYTRDFKDIKTTGNLAFNGYVKGVYKENSLPSFRLDVKVDNAEFRYPDLPSSINNINIDLNVTNPGGSEDYTVVDIRKMHFTLIDNPFELKALVKNPVSDPYIDASLVTSLNLADIGKVYPLEDGESLRGKVDANITLKGRQSAIENQQYEKFDAFGSLMVKDIEYTMEAFNDKFHVKNAQLNFAPAYLDLVNLDFQYAGNDMVLKGKVENYIPYAMSGGILKGQFTASSDYFDVDRFMGSEEEGKSAQELTDTTELTVFQVPADLDMNITASFRELVYDSIPLSNVRGQIIVKDEKVMMKNLRGDLFGGNIGINGSYSTHNTGTPVVDLALDISSISFYDAFDAFGILQKYVPMAGHAMGDFSTAFSFSTSLDDEMMPLWETFNGNGLLNANTVKLEKVNTLNQLSEALKTDMFRSMKLDPLKVAFDFQGGKLIVKPFDMNIEGMKASLSGWTAIDQSIGYDLNMEMPRKVIGSEANKVIDGLISQANAAGANFSAGETIPVDVIIGGTLSKPTVKPVIGKMTGNIVDDIKNDLKQEIDKKKEELEQQAKDEAKKILDDAEKQAQKLLAEAQKQSDQVRSLAREGAQKIRKEADAHAEKLIAEGKKNGMLAEAAAKKTADEYKKKAYSEADKGVAEADKKADAIMNTARQQADKIRAEAQKKVDSL